jgi:hypothetical protein
MAAVVRDETLLPFPVSRSALSRLVSVDRLDIAFIVT